MISRRKFLIGTVALMATPMGMMTLADALPLTNSLPATEGANFDMRAAKHILSWQSPLMSRDADGGIYLDLTGFPTYTQDALNHLVDNIGGIDGISVGFRNLCPEAALALTRLRSGFCYLSDLVRLDSDAAEQFWWWDKTHRPIRDIVIHEPISEETAFALAEGPRGYVKEEDYSNRPLSLSVPSINSAVAGALRQHNHELFLHIRDGQIPPDAAKELAQHVGYSLTLNIDGVLSPDSLHALSSNPAKRIKQSWALASTRVYLVNTDMWSDFYEQD